MAKIKDLTGKSFNRWLVLGNPARKNGSTYWDCVCSCGEKRQVAGANLVINRTKSCGCLKIEEGSKHGHYGSRTYRTWNMMLQRCLNKKNDHYADYGGRGISVCERWRKFENFLEDMGKRPKDTTLDRVDNSKGYFLENCRWASQKEQTRNRRPNLGAQRVQKRGNRWRSRVVYKGKLYNLGTFPTKEEAQGKSKEFLESKGRKWR